MLWLEDDMAVRKPKPEAVLKTPGPGNSSVAPTRQFLPGYSTGAAVTYVAVPTYTYTDGASTPEV